MYASLRTSSNAPFFSAEDRVIHGYNLPASLQLPIAGEAQHSGSLDAKLAAVEYEMIVDALKAHRGNTTLAASQLGLTRPDSRSAHESSPAELSRLSLIQTQERAVNNSKRGAASQRHKGTAWPLIE